MHCHSLTSYWPFLYAKQQAGVNTILIMYSLVFTLRRLLQQTKEQYNLPPCSQLALIQRDVMLIMMVM